MQGTEPDRKGYCFNEMGSLGIPARRTNELNDRKEMRDLVENVKQLMHQQYRRPYTE